MAIKVDYQQDTTVTLTDIEDETYTFHLLEVEELSAHKSKDIFTVIVRDFRYIFITKEDYYELKEQLDNCAYVEEVHVTTKYQVVR